MNFLETYVLDEDMNLTKKRAPAKKFNREKYISKMKTNVKNSQKAETPMKKNKNIEALKEESKVLKPSPAPELEQTTNSGSGYSPSWKKFDVQVQAEGLFFDEAGLNLRCKYCCPYTEFDHLMDFLGHMLKEHEDGYVFKCRVCNEHCYGSSIAAHFAAHNKPEISLFYSGCDGKNNSSNKNQSAPADNDYSDDSSDMNQTNDLLLDSGDEYLPPSKIDDFEIAELGECTLDVKNEVDENVDNDANIAERSDEGRFTCKQCDLNFRDTWEVMQHMAKDHKDEMQSHVDVTSLKKELTDALPTDTSSVSSYRKKKVLCPHCGNYVLAHGLKVHIRRHTGEKPYRCTLCDKKFASTTELHAHTKVHTGERPYLCNICGKSFSNSGFLKDHVLMHTVDKFECKYCDKKYSSMHYFRVHLRTHPKEMGKTDNVSYGPFTCDVCNKELSSLPSLIVHMRVHTKEKPFQCEICPKNFSHRGTLKSHMIEHFGDKPFKCSECNKAYNLGKQLAEHMRIHTGEKPYQCTMCNKSFRLASSFWYHKKYGHSGLKEINLKPKSGLKRVNPKSKFSCDFCDSSFCLKRELRDHVNIHTNARKHQCSLCTRSYSYRSVLRTHMTTKHGIVFSRRSKLALKMENDEID